MVVVSPENLKASLGALILGGFVATGYAIRFSEASLCLNSSLDTKKLERCSRYADRAVLSPVLEGQAYDEVAREFDCSYFATVPAAQSDLSGPIRFVSVAGSRAGIGVMLSDRSLLDFLHTTMVITACYTYFVDHFGEQDVTDQAFW